MATPAPTISRQAGTNDGSLFVATWVLTSADTTGVAVELPEWADRTWQVGTSGDSFGATGVCSIQGCHTNVDADFATLSNAAGATAATFSAAGVKTVIELTRYMRPKLTTPGTNASVTVILVARRANPMRN